MSDHLPVTIELHTTESLSTNDVVYKNGIKIVGSNVVTERLTLSIRENNINSLAIYNTLGQKISELKTNNASNLTIDVSKLASGVYYIISSNKLTEPLKFVIQ
jgi:hypothetical protein